MTNVLQRAGKSLKAMGTSLVMEAFDDADALLAPMDTVGVMDALRGRGPIGRTNAYLRTGTSLVLLTAGFMSGAFVAGPGALLERSGNGLERLRGRIKAPAIGLG